MNATVQVESVTALPRRPLLAPALSYGFAIAAAIWVAWFITHLPWLALDERARLPAVLLVWVAAACAVGANYGAGGWRVGAAAGLVSSLVGLLVLGSRLAQPPEAGDVSAGLKPGAGQIALGFIALGVAVGAIGGAAGSLARGLRTPASEPDWLARFALVACFAAAPLLFVGGLVTSTNSGMAVPDWPNSYGSNMFLYPLGSWTSPDRYLEHSHRLFGSLVGLTTTVLTIWSWARERRAWVKSLALVALAVVVTQGVLGGLRVLANSPGAGMVHGVLAQLTLALLVSLAVVLAPTWRSAGPDQEPAPLLRRLRLFSTGLLHASILQLVFGAAYRHFRDSHSLWAHIGFSLVVVILAMGAGFLAVATAGEHGGIGRSIRRLGRAVLVVVLLQFLLGWLALLAGGTSREAPGPAQALIRTVHQANGALLLALATALFLWTRRLVASRRVPAPAL